MINLYQIFMFHPDGTDLSIDIDDNYDGVLYIKQGDDWICIPYDRVLEVAKALKKIGKVS